ncbi:MAG: choice-of-anchor Q domain-containing protein [Chromatiales bacterium]
MSRSSHPRSNGKHRYNRKQLNWPPLGERTDELLPRVQGYYARLCALPRRTRRALVRQWRRSLSAIALLLALGQAPALAATINVDGTACTLIDAITSANTDAVAGGCPPGNGADTIVLPAGSTQLLTAVDNITLGPTGLPVITSTVTLRGRNSTIRRESSAPDFRILAVDSSGDLTLHNTTVSGGYSDRGLLYSGGGVYNSGILTLTNSTVSGNYVYSGGGGVLNSGTLTLTNSTVSGNSIINHGSGSGGVFNSGTLTLTNSTVSGNRITGLGFGGGGVSNTGTLTLTNSTVSGNSANYGGGGVDNSGTATLTNSTVSGNFDGGGMHNSGMLTLTNSTVSGNFGGSGGVSNSGTATLTNSTVSGNYVAYYGGGVYNSGTLVLTRALISGNHSALVPEASEVYTNMTRPPEAIIVANNHNLFGHDGDAGVTGFSPGPTDIVPNVPFGAILKPLADNGGPTKTHALPVGSPAIGKSPANSGCKPTDQRGVTRPQGAACDIGAFEKGPPVRCGGRIARILGSLGNNRLIGTPGSDVIHGLAGRDTIDGLEGNDIICGGTGNDILFGDNGADKLNGGSGSDTCRGGTGTDTGVSCETATSIP